MEIRATECIRVDTSAAGEAAGFDESAAGRAVTQIGAQALTVGCGGLHAEWREGQTAGSRDLALDAVTGELLINTVAVEIGPE